MQKGWRTSVVALDKQRRARMAGRSAAAARRLTPPPPRASEMHYRRARVVRVPACLSERRRTINAGAAVETRRQRPNVDDGWEASPCLLSSSSLFIYHSHSLAHTHTHIHTDSLPLVHLQQPLVRSRIATLPSSVKGQAGRCIADHDDARRSLQAKRTRSLVARSSHR